MSTSAWTRILVIPVAAVGMFLSGTAKAGNPFMPAKWERIASAEGGFSVLMPGRANETSVPVKVPQGSLTQHNFNYSAGSEHYEVTYEDFLDNMEEGKRLEYLRNLLAPKNKILTDIHIWKNGHPGRLITLRLEDGRYAATAFYAMGARVIFACYTSTTPGELVLHGTPFLYSFQLTR